MFLFSITIGMCLVYFLMRIFLPYFLRGENDEHIDGRAYRSISLIIAVSIASYALSDLIKDPWWENRVLHALGGGFLGAMVCFLAVHEDMPHLEARRFIALTILVVTTLGVLNELIELALQNFTNAVFTADIFDTWWDLASNMVGAIVGAVVFAPFVRSSTVKIDLGV